MTEKPIDRQIFPVDSNHAGVRLTIFVACVSGLSLSYMVINPVLSTILNLSGIVEVVFALSSIVITTGLFGYVSESIVKRIWRSGRTLAIDQAGISLRGRGTLTSVLWVQQTTIIRWRFTISSSRTWVPKGWHCVALQVTDANGKVTVYAFVSPADAAKIHGLDRFQLLTSTRVGSGTSEDSSEMALAREAEKQRWVDGAEVDKNDLHSILEIVNRFDGSSKANSAAANDNKLA